MDVLHISVALLPLALYLIWQGVHGLSRRPRVISGTWNTLGLSWALLGLFMVGPLPLLLPDHAIQRFGGWIWWMVLTLYVLVSILIVLLARPHAYVSNIGRETLRPVIAEITRRMDQQCAWAGDSAALPQAGLEFRVEAQPFFKVIHLQALGPKIGLAAWDHLLAELRTELRQVKTGPRPWSFGELAVGLSLFGWVAVTTRSLWLVPQELPQGIGKIFRELLSM